MPRAIDAARYLLAHQDRSEGEEVSNLKLQKLLYYAQGYHLALFGKPLFADDIEAWDLGPVVPDVYRAFKDFGGAAIDAPISEPQNVDDTARETLDRVIDGYGQFTATRLAQMTHGEPPWLGTGRNHSISHDALQTFFRAVLQQPSGRPANLDKVLGDPTLHGALDQAIRDVSQGKRTEWQTTTPRASSSF